MAEQRKFVRLDSSIAVEYRIAGKVLHPSVNSITRNISSGGIRIHLRSRLPIGSNLDIALKLPNLEHSINVVGQVVWVEPNKEGSYDAGIKYVQVDPDDIQKITDYVLRCLGKRLSETQGRISVSKKTMMFLYKEIRVPGDNSKKIEAPNFLINEVNLPGDKVRYALISSSLSLKCKMVSGDKLIEDTSSSQYVSGRGIWFLSSHDIAVNSVIEAHLNLPDSGVPIIAICVVDSSRAQTRCDDKSKKLYYEIGMRFKTISASDRKRVIRYVYNCKTDYLMIGKVPPPDWLRIEKD
jgi:c-di-GMP-binding flagellar brake protein YcgR